MMKINIEFHPWGGKLKIQIDQKMNDYLDRARMELIPLFGFKPLDNQLGDPNSQTPQNDIPKNSLSSPQ